MYFERDPRAGMGSVYAMLLLQKGTKEVAVIHFMHAVREFSCRARANSSIDGSRALRCDRPEALCESGMCQERT